MPAGMVAHLCPAPSLLGTPSPGPSLCRDSAVLPVPPLGTQNPAGQSIPLQQPLTRSLGGYRLHPTRSFQQMVLQAALLQSLEQ